MASNVAKIGVVLGEIAELGHLGGAGHFFSLIRNQLSLKTG